MKGVICHIAEPHEMPVDAAGNRADIIMDPNARLARMNLGGLYEPYINAIARDFLSEIRSSLGIKSNSLMDAAAIKLHPNYEHIKARVLRLYEIIVPQTHDFFLNKSNRGFEHHIAHLLIDGFYFYYPPSNPPEGPQIVRMLEKEFKGVYGPVTYIGNSGERRITKRNVRIGSMYIIILDKIGDDRTAVSSSKLQNFGVLAPITARDKYASPIRRQAIRAFGETEVRILIANIGSENMAELLDRNNNILTHRQGLEKLYLADKPTDIENFVDRSTNPLGNARPLQLVKHLAFCGGWRFAYKKFEPNLINNLAESD